MPFIENPDGTEQLIVPHGTTAQAAAMGSTLGDLMVDTDAKTLRFDDGTTPGGQALATVEHLVGVVQPLVVQAQQAKADAQTAVAHVGRAIDKALPVGRNLHDVARIIDNASLNADGTTSARASAYVTAPIPVEVGTPLRLNQPVSGRGYFASYVCLDAVGTVIGAAGFVESYAIGAAINPPNLPGIATMQFTIYRDPADDGTKNYQGADLMANWGAAVLPFALFGAITLAVADQVRTPLLPQIAAVATPANRWVPAIRADDGTLLPPTMVADLDGKRGFLAGRRVTLASLLGAVAGPSTRIADAAWAAVLAGLQGGLGVMVDYSFPDLYTTANQPSGCLFSMGEPGSPYGRFEIVAQETGAATGPLPILPGGGYDATCSWTAGLSGGTLTTGVALAESSTPGLTGQASRRRYGVHRITASLPFDAVTPALGLDNAGLVSPNTAGRTASAAPAGAMIGNGLAFGHLSDHAAPLTNCVIHQVVIYPRPLTATEIKRAGMFNERRLPPIFSGGDSGTNNLVNLDAMLLALKPYGYIPHYGQGHGGRGWKFHAGLAAALIAYDDTFRDFLPMIWELSLDTTDIAFGLPDTDSSGNATPRENIGPIRNIMASFIRPTMALFREQRFILPESSPNFGAGDLPTYLAQMEALRTTFPLAWTPHVQRLILETVADNGRSIDDEYAYNVANHHIPLPLLTSATDQHYNVAGQIVAGAVNAARYLNSVGAPAA